MAALRNGSKCSHTSCMLCFFTVSCLTLNPNLIFEIGSSKISLLLRLRLLSFGHYSPGIWGLLQQAHKEFRCAYIYGISVRLHSPWVFSVVVLFYLS